MKQFIKQTDEVVKWNLRQLVVFEVLYRLVAGAFYVRMVNALLRFSLHMAGYSYLTMSNMRAFFLRPVTVGCAALALAVLAVIFLLETGSLLTLYQAAAYGRRLDFISILKGGLEKVWDEWEKRDWQLLFLVMANYLTMSAWILLRVLSRIKPVNFVMYEILHSPGARFVLAAGVVFLVAVGIPTMLVSFACMIEQKRFRDGVTRSRALLRGKWPGAVLLFLAVNVVVFLIIAALYVVGILISALLVLLFVDSYAAAAVFITVCMRLEMAVLFVGSCLVVIVDFGALTVIYYRYNQDNVHVGQWDFSRPGRAPLKRKWVLRSVLLLAAGSTFLIFDMARNGVSMDWAPLGMAEVTAHRGSSKMAPENTLAALEAAMDEMADYSEIDVQTTADGVVVLFHDLNAKRMTGVDRRISAMTWEEVQKLDAGKRMGSRFAGERIPTLEQALEACKGRMRLNIELKNLGDRSDLPEKVAALIEEYGMEDQCVISSVKLKYLQRVKEYNPNLRTGYILAAAYGRYYENEWIDFISIRSSFVTRHLVNACHENGKALHVWTINSETEMEQMKMLRVDNLITDYPTRAREVLYEEEGTERLLRYIRMMLK